MEAEYFVKLIAFSLGLVLSDLVNCKINSDIKKKTLKYLILEWHTLSYNYPIYKKGYFAID